LILTLREVLSCERRRLDGGWTPEENGGDMSDFGHARYEAEARERWGDTEAYRESSRRTRNYSEDDWATIKAQAEAIEAGFAAALEAGDPPDGERAVGLAEQARLHIDRWFYPCNTEMHASLAKMYTADPRFRAHYEDRTSGLAEYVSAAIRANSGRRRA
jgi:hypothetical protein